MQIYEVCSQPPEFKTGGDEPNDINDILLMMICEIKLKFAGLVWFTKHHFLIVISQEHKITIDSFTILKFLLGNISSRMG